MYRKSDYEIVFNNIDKIEESAKKAYLNNFEPKISEYRSVYSLIKDYIRSNNLIVYGGYGQNTLIKNKNEKDVFYKETDLSDIEFFSPEPLKDLINLCDLINRKGYKYVEGKEGAHNETYKIYVNFHNYLDISYMPKKLFDSCPYIMGEGMKITPPNMMLTDAYRIYTDPMTSYRILGKTFKRFNLLMTHYPFNNNLIYNNFSFNVNLSEKEYDNVSNFIRKNIVRKSKLVMVGFQPFNRLMEKAKMPDSFYVQEPFYQLISYEYSKDKDKIFNLLKNKFINITKKSYYRFFQYLDESTEYFYKDQLILKLFGNNERCTVYQYSEKKKIHYGTFQLQILYLLFHYLIGIFKKNKFMETYNMTMIVRLFKARDTFLEKNKLNVLDKSPFQEFTYECLGEAKDTLRSSLLEGLARKKQGKRMKFSYRPSTSGNPGKIPNYRFENSSGELKN
jgi:hypothetical protein